ncbi:MAG: hypothetical protein SD837_00030 [Candidatus Electrothrix scaldis]|nr:MAG: hypothetical protein SD837_00030 [Candidatus Electrothrix sp. GW3-3]
MVFAAQLHVMFSMDMKNQFTEQEKAFFKLYRNSDSILKRILIGLSLLLFFGLLLDALNGFMILRNSKSVLHGIVGLLILTVIYITGEGLTGKVAAKDSVDHPLYKRIYHLFLLLLVTTSFTGVCFLVFNLMW